MESGTVGLVPIRASPGDRVCILRGCPVPFVLCDPGIPGTFGLIGECYVRGLMKERDYAVREVYRGRAAIRIIGKSS
jgi:hypothetical protein